VIRNFCGIIFIALLWIPSATSQENTTNLRDMLATVPDTSTNRENPIAFFDIRAAERARPIETPVNSWDELLSIGGTFEGDRYWSLAKGLRSLTSNYQGQHWQDFVGVDWFDIDRIIEYGKTLQEVTTLEGNFDLDTIAMTLSSRDYTLDPMADFTLWCGTVGCENGLQTVEENIVKGYPFGANLGRQQPIYISDDTIISAPILTNLDETYNTINGTRDTLATDPAYQAAINAIDPENILIQASFFDSSTLVMDDEVRDSRSVEAQIDIFHQADIPPYELVFVADTVITGVQVVYIVMVYDDDEYIDSVTEIVTNRLQTMRSLTNTRLFSTIIEERGIFRISTTTMQIDESTGKSLVILRVFSPSLSSLEAASGEVDKFAYSSEVYWLFFNLMLNNDTLWIASEIAD
jgi:hypothetical protein